MRTTLLACVVALAGCAADPAADCCAVCESGKPCGDACIAPGERCEEGAGCACTERGRRGITESEPEEPDCVSSGEPTSAAPCCGRIVIDVVITTGGETITRETCE